MNTVTTAVTNRCAEALPANLRSGQQPQTAPPASWAPLEHSYASLPERPPAWVAPHLDGLSRLDVRSAEEAAGHDGRMSSGLLIPLPELVNRLGECPAISPWWCLAIPAAAPPWPPSSCFRRAVRRWPTCAAA